MAGNAQRGILASLTAIRSEKIAATTSRLADRRKSNGCVYFRTMANHIKNESFILIRLGWAGGWRGGYENIPGFRSVAGLRLHLLGPMH